MFDAICSLFTLRWTQQPIFRLLPNHIKRTLVSSPGGNLELLTSSPPNPDPEAAPIFFIHGGYGSAGVWIEWMTYLREAGYRGQIYAYSARNHGASYSVPYFKMVYRTSFKNIVRDFTTCLEFARKQQRADQSNVDFILVGHSSGGGLAQYVLSKSLARCRALCLVDAIPHFGALPVYANWARHDPWFMLRSLFHLQHPTSPLSSQRLVHGAFFGDKFPRWKTKEFMRWMPAYETMNWPMSMMGSFAAWWKGASRWLGVNDILNNIHVGSSASAVDRICVMVADQDVLMDVNMARKQVAEYREGLTQRQMSLNGKQNEIQGKSATKAIDGVKVESDQGVRLIVIAGAGHHVQNDAQRDAAAEAILQFAQQC